MSTCLQVRTLLNLGGTGQARPSTGAQAPGIGRFLLPLSECEFALESAVDDLLVRACLVVVISQRRWIFPLIC